MVTLLGPYGSRRGGNSLRAAAVLNDDSTSYRTGPNMSTMPSSRYPYVNQSVQSKRPRPRVTVSSVRASGIATAVDAAPRHPELHEREHEQREREDQRGCRGNPVQPYRFGESRL